MARSGREETRTTTNGYLRASSHYKFVQKIDDREHNVHLAKYGKKSNVVTIKVVDSDTVLNNVYSLATEIKVAETYHHKNLHEVYCSFSDEKGGLWVVMPPPLTSSMNNVIRRLAPVSLLLHDAAFVLKQVLKGLNFLHNLEKPMLHRYVDLNHIFLDVNFEVKLVFDTLVYEPDLFMTSDRNGSKAGNSSLVDLVLLEDVNGYGFPSEVWGFGVAAMHIVLGDVPMINQSSDLDALLEQIKEKNRKKMIKKRLAVGGRMCTCFGSEGGGGGAITDAFDEQFEDFIQMVRWCMQPKASQRPSTKQLLDLPFFQKVDDEGASFKKMMKSMMKNWKMSNLKSA